MCSAFVTVVQQLTAFSVAIVHLCLVKQCLLLQRARQQRSEAKAKKAEGQRRNTKVQQISNPATIKKMMKDKKQRKKLMTVDPANAAKGHA